MKRFDGERAVSVRQDCNPPQIPMQKENTTLFARIEAAVQDKKSGIAGLYRKVRVQGLDCAPKGF